MVENAHLRGEGNPFRLASDKNGSFSAPAPFRTLDSVKMLPNTRSSRSRSLSPYRHASGARTNESASIATTAITVRSAIQIREDRAFREGFHKAELNEATEERAKWLDLVPLTHGCGQKGIGLDAGKVWKGNLREIQPESAKGDPVANNSTSRDGFRNPSTPGFFSKHPERLGQWRDDFQGNGCKGQWIPNSELRRYEREEQAKEAKALQEAHKKEREAKELQERERRRREDAAREAREAAERQAEARERAAKEAEARAEKVRQAAERRAALKLEQERKAANLMRRSSTVNLPLPSAAMLQQFAHITGDL